MTKSTRSLTRTEARVLADIAAGDGEDPRRARAILHWASDPDIRRTAKVSGLRPGQVRHWVAAFRRRRLDIFPPPPPERPRAGSAPDPAVTPYAPDRAGAPVGGDSAGGGQKAGVRRPRIRRTGPMADALRKILAFHFGRVKKLEGAAFEADEDAVHDMRVAFRRLRAALRIARPFFRRKRVRGLAGELQAATRALGAVRDLDVILAHAVAGAQQPPAGGAGLWEWIRALQEERADARRDLQAYLASKRFARFRKDFQAFLAEARSAGGGKDAPPADSGPGPARVCDVVPPAIWSQYAAVRVYEPLEGPSIETLHALRIEIKRFRYLLEFFESALGVRVRPMVALAVESQDRLGQLHDRWVAAGLLREYAAGTVLPGGSDLTPVAAYLAALQAEMDGLRRAFADTWQELGGKPFRVRLARLLSRI